MIFCLLCIGSLYQDMFQIILVTTTITFFFQVILLIFTMGLFGCGRINKIIGAVFTSAIIVALNPVMSFIHPALAQSEYNWATTGWLLLFIPMLRTRPLVAIQVIILSALMCALCFAQIVKIDSLFSNNTIEFIVFFGWALGLGYRPTRIKFK